jgi:two-component system cell cycle sensor histidine kinase/response regulator CckA
VKSGSPRLLPTWRSVLDAVREAACLLDREGTIVGCNRAYAALVGRQPKDVVGLNCCSLVHGGSHRTAECPLARMPEAPWRHEGGYQLNGRWVRDALDPVLDGIGKPVGAVHTLSDITELRRTEQALREAELELRALAETTSVGILLVQDERFTYANAAAERITGYSSGELTGRPFLEVVHPEFRELVGSRAASRLMGVAGLPSRYEIKIITKSGTERWLDLSSAVVVLEGKPALVATVADITEERRLRHIQAAIYEISQATQTARDLQELYRSIHAVIGRLMEARNFYIALYDAGTNLISFPYFVDEVDPTPEPFPLGRGLTSYVVRSGRPLLATPEVLRQLEQRGLVEALGAASIDWVGVPLVIGDKTVGVLAVQSYAEGVRYGHEDEEVLTHVSREVALAIERKRAQDLLASTNTRLVREADQRSKAEELRAAIYEIAEAAQRVTSLDELFVAVHEVVGRFMETSSFLIALYDSDRDLITFPYHRSSVISAPAPFRPGRGLISHVLRTGRALLGTPEVLEEFRRRGDVHTVGRPAVSWLGVPLTIGNEVRGVLAVQTFLETGQYGERERDILTFMSGQIGSAIERKRAEEALRESEGRYRQLVELSPDAIVVHSAGKVLFVNPACMELLGAARPEQIVGRSVLDFVHPACWDSVTERVERMTQTGRRVPLLEEQFLRVDGTAIDVEAAAMPIVFEGKHAVQVVFHDVSERKRTEAALQASETRYRAFFEQAPVGIYQTTPDGRILGANPALLSMLKYESFEDLVAHNLELGGFEPGTSRASFKEVLERQGEVRGLQAVWTAKDGTPVFIRESARAIRGPDGAVAHYEGTVEDITRSMAAEIERQRLSEAVKQAAETVVITDTDGRIQYVNPAFERITGYTKAEAIGQKPSILKSGRHEDSFYASIWQTIKSGETWHGRFVNKRKDGALYEEDATISPIRDADGVIRNFVAVKRDITQEVALESQLRQSQKMEAIGHLAGGVAHDFNNLLQAMLSHAQLLRAPMLDPAAVVTAVNQLEQQIQRGAALTRQLLLFSRRETTKRERFSLNDSVQDATQVLRRLVQANISLSTELGVGNLLIEADWGQLQQVLMNLALNASDAMPDGGVLEIRTGTGDGDEVWLSVTDSGRGIPETIRDHIFEPFFTTKEPGKGTGLGLSVVDGIVASHGGRVEVESRVGEGATFKVIFPKAPPGDVSQAGDSPVPGADVAVGRGERVLVVEDEEGARQAIRDLLVSIGYEVVAVESAEDAEKLAQDRPFDVLLTDVMLPGVDGQQLSRRLLRRWPSLKVILMSGYAKDDAVRVGVMTGAVRFLQKPFGITTLAAAVRGALDAPVAD